jgi:7-cyano-7-deazaguanine reductase
MKTEDLNLKTLGKARAKYEGLETFEKPKRCGKVILISDEVTAVCPVTGQPDFYTVEVEYYPFQKCVESKTFKLFVQSFRDQGHFCEKFADLLLEELVKAMDPKAMTVRVHQKPRGGVAIISESHYSK